jgi:hypothetical protein
MMTHSSPPSIDHGSRQRPWIGASGSNEWWPRPRPGSTPSPGNMATRPDSCVGMLRSPVGPIRRAGAYHPTPLFCDSPPRSMPARTEWGRSAAAGVWLWGEAATQQEAMRSATAQAIAAAKKKDTCYKPAWVVNVCVAKPGAVRCRADVASRWGSCSKSGWFTAGDPGDGWRTPMILVYPLPTLGVGSSQGSCSPNGPCSAKH